MPLNLDSCITGIFVPGNIGASSGQTPIVRVMPPRLPATLAVQINEVTTATAMVAVSGDVAATVMETVAAVDVVAVPQILDEGIAEWVVATDAPSVLELGVYDADLTEALTAADVQDATLGVALVPRSAMLPQVFANSDGTVRQANANGVMVNL